MSPFKKFIKQFSHFLSGSILSQLFSFVTFPILTRVLTKEQYGILGLVTTTMLFAVAIAKAGLSDGIIRSPLMVRDWCFVEENSFNMQLEYLKKHFEIISLSEAVERMRNGEIKRPTAVITFDDGYQNNFDVAFPILYRERMPATIFLTTGLINTNDTVWYCRFNLALSQTRRPHIEWNGFKFDLSTLDLKAEASAAIQESLKKLEDPKLMATIGNIILELGDDPDCPIEIGSPFRMLDKKAIGEMAASGLIEFGAHTHHHTSLSQLSDEERHNEIRQSTNAIDELTGAPCRYFAYPNGRAEDYNRKTIKDLETCGIENAVTTISGPNNRITPAMELRRYGIGAHLPMAEFQLMVHHFYYKSLQLFRREDRHLGDQREC
jgi:peptidoglycan/xylan/chitin deacetylase (PgdA/CDA1 family)